MRTLLTPLELDRLLRYPPGRAERLARRGKLPHIILPDGAVRFDANEIASLIDLAARSEVNRGK